ncbi:CS1-pili formation C-terminal domain-containing protein [Acinetobacter pullicarnis]|uniref:CS1-pili formation C-terminal domain-containing protein n=1 Tax=Acinetobacter pullicarnis TaxID=2576829 RepID=UPI00111DE7E9|nr:CS1-pili formation C-terminal domain-containing protein [Acinetobacter pullicarnis]
MKIYRYSITLGMVGLIAIQSVYSEEAPPLRRIGTLVLPSVLTGVMESGLSIPVYLKYDKQPLDAKSNQKIADAVVYLRENKLYIREVSIAENLQTTELTQQTKTLLDAIRDKELDENLVYYVANNASLKLDLKSMYLELLVDESAIGTKKIARSDVLGRSTVDKFSSVLSYRFGTYYNEYDGQGNSSNYLTLNSVSSLKENHFILNASAYGIGTNNSDFEVYRALYERDHNGYRFAAGMMDTWSIQSIASLNGINTSKIYGLSYGNLSNTVIQNTSLSLTPINVFLPSAGTVQIYREGRLLSIQNFPLGSHEVDTSNLPSGSYSVDVKTFVNGEEINSTVGHINKSFDNRSMNIGKVNWQLFGGMLKYNQTAFKNPNQLETELKNRETNGWLFGVALNKDYAWLSGTSFRSSIYAFTNDDNNDRNLVAELSTNVALTPEIFVNWQTLLATDSTFKNTLTANYNLPQGYGSVWGSREYTTIGNKLAIEKRDYYNLGGSLNVKKIYDKLGYLSLSYSKDLERKNDFVSAEYNQDLFNFKYATVSFRAGLQRNTFTDSSTGVDGNNDFYSTQKNNDKYVYFDVRLPLSKWFSAGVSSRNDNLLATAAYKQSFDGGFIRNVGVDISKPISTSGESSGSRDASFSGYAGYEHKFNSGSLSASASGSNYSLNYTSQGIIAYAEKKLALSATNLESGVMINTGLKDNGKMSAVVNGQAYQISGKRSFIPLSPYKEYTIELANDKKSLDSVNIVRGRHNKITLYPGNVSVLNPEIQQMITVFGRIYYPSGELARKVNINNHIGKTVTDENGEFSLDVDKRYPILTLIENNGELCEAALKLKPSDRVVWVGDLHCEMKKTSSQVSLLEARK